MNINPIFSSFLVIEQLDGLDNKSLEIYCREKIKQNDKQNQSGYLNLNDEHLIPLVEYLNHICKQIHNEIGLDQNKNHFVSRMWANLNNNVAIDQPHIHPNSIFSGVYYPYGNDKSGHLKIMNPICGFSHVFSNDIIKNRTQYSSGEIAIPPAQGRLIIFPSWMMHYVTMCFGERVSIAFDTNIVV